MNHRCYFCEMTPTGQYTITSYYKLIEPICAACFDRDLTVNHINYPDYPRLASLEKAEEALVRFKLFGEEP